jgi:hypothetical protein
MNNEPHKDLGEADRAAPSPDFPASVDQMAARPLTEPHPARLSPDNPAYAQIIRVHAEALRAGEDTYVDPPSGFTVLTAGYLARRGSCCENGCRHCPYVS